MAVAALPVPSHRPMLLAVAAPSRSLDDGAGDLLAAGGPLSLLLDLAWPPDSRVLLGGEGGSAAWLRASA